MKRKAFLPVCLMIVLLSACGERITPPKTTIATTGTTESTVCTATTTAIETTMSSMEPSTTTTTTSPTITTTTTTTTKSTTTTTKKPTSVKVTTTKKTTVTTTCKHTHTEVRDRKEPTTSAGGFTGDVYCTDCGKILESGTVIQPLQDEHAGQFRFELEDGEVIWVDEAVEARLYTMKKATRSVTRAYAEAEKEILRLCNVERKKAGLSELSWYEDAYYFTQIRANESLTKFSHERPNGENWDAVYRNAGVVLYNTWGENLYGGSHIGDMDSIVERSVDGWMNSPGHRANILNENYTEVAISIVVDGDDVSIVQNFFG